MATQNTRRCPTSAKGLCSTMCWRCTMRPGCSLVYRGRSSGCTTKSWCPVRTSRPRRGRCAEGRRAANRPTTCSTQQEQSARAAGLCRGLCHCAPARHLQHKETAADQYSKQSRRCSSHHRGTASGAAGRQPPLPLQCRRVSAQSRGCAWQRAGPGSVQLACSGGQAVLPGPAWQAGHSRGSMREPLEQEPMHGSYDYPTVSATSVHA